MGEFVLNSQLAAIIVGMLLIIGDVWYWRDVVRKNGALNNMKKAILNGVISFVECLYIAVFFAGRVSPNDSGSMFTFSLGIELTVIGLISFTILLFVAKGEIKGNSKSKENAQNTYFVKNPVLGFAMGHYMFGIICLTLVSMYFVLLPFIGILLKGPIAVVVGFTLFILWIFVLPMYIVGKTPSWFSNSLNRVK